MSFSVRILRGVFAGGAGFFVNLLQAAVQVPVLLHYWGAEKMGVWLSLVAVGVLMTTLDAGHHAYLGNLLNRLYVIDHETFLSTLGAGVRISLVVGFIPLVFIAVGYAAFDLRSLMSVPSAILSEKEVSLLLLIQMVQWSYTFAVGGVLGHLYIAKGDFARYTYWGAAYRLLSTLCLFISVASGFDIWGAVIIQALFCVSYHVFQWWDLRRRYPEFYPWWSKGTVLQGWGNYKLSLVLTFNNFGQQLMSQGLVLLVARSLGSAAVPLYASTRTMVNVAQTGNSIVINPLVPEIGRLDAVGDHFKIERLLRTAVFMSSLIVLIAFLVSLWAAEPVFNLWTGRKLSFDAVFLMLLLTALALRMAGSALMAYLISVNDLRGQTWATWINAALVFGLGAMLMPSWGLRGLGVAMVAGEAIGSLFLPLLSVRARWKLANRGLDYLLVKTVAASALILLLVGFMFFKFYDYKLIVSALLVVAIGIYVNLNFNTIKGLVRMVAGPRLV